LSIGRPAAVKQRIRGVHASACFNIAIGALIAVGAVFPPAVAAREMQSGQQMQVTAPGSGLTTPASPAVNTATPTGRAAAPSTPTPAAAAIQPSGAEISVAQGNQQAAGATATLPPTVTPSAADLEALRRL
jgi:hypothetical protein